jgi:membrane-associated phospholipid phosphatase
VRAWLLAAFTFFSLSLLTFHWDHGLSEWIRFHPALNRLFAVSALATTIRAFGKTDVLLCIVFALGAAGERKTAARILLALVIAMALIWPLKLGVNRVRPYGDKGESFPSGDAAAVAAFAVPLVSCSTGFLPVVAAATGAVGLLRVYESAHYPSDVLAGIGFGLLAGVLAGAAARHRNLLPARSFFILLAILLPAGRLLVGSSAKGWLEFLAFLKTAGPVFLALLAARFIRFELRKRPAPRGWRK